MRIRTGCAVLMVAVALGCNTEPALLRQMRKEQLIEDTRDRLLESVETEKSAVLSTREDEARSLVAEAQRLNSSIDQMRDELRTLIDADSRSQETEAFAAFNNAWTKLKQIDERLLVLAVANSNLKAAQISANEGTVSLDRFVDTVSELQRSTTDPAVIITLSQASVAALRVPPLVAVHIPSADAGEMTRLEQRIDTLKDEVNRDLGSARESGVFAPALLDQATAAWGDYQRIVVDVLRLSRENADVISSDVSIHEKRHATKACLDALDALEQAVESQPRPMR